MDDRLKAREAFMKGLNYTPEVVQNNLPGFKNMTIFNKASIDIEHFTSKSFSACLIDPSQTDQSWGGKCDLFK